MLRIGILGAARIAPAAIIEPASRRNDVEIVAVASRRPGAAAGFAQQYNITRSYNAYEALLADPEIDLVYVALPPVEHARQSIAALEAGKHVLCEKPFAMNAREAQVMIETADRTGKRLIEAFHYRYHPFMAEILTLVQGGLLGAVSRIEAEFSAPIPFAPRSLRHLPELGGGAMMDLGCYAVHWVRTLLGAQPQVREAHGRRTPLGVDEAMSAELDLPGGGTARIATDMSEDVVQTARLAVEGEKGRLVAENPVLPHLGHTMRANLSGVFHEKTVGGGTTYDYQLEAVLGAIEMSQALPTEGADSLQNMQLIDQIYKKAGFLSRS